MSNQLKIKIDSSHKKSLPDVNPVPVDTSGPVPESINSLYGDNSVDLIDAIVDEKGDRRTTFPENAIKNRAAYAALLSGVPNITEIYQSVVAENRAGVDYTRKAIMDKVTPGVEQEARSGVISILADPNVPLEEKRKAIASLNDGFVKEPATILANAGFAAPVKNESPEAEDIRISGAELFRSHQEYQALKQGLLNRHNTIAAQQGEGNHLVDFLEQLVPFAVNKHGYSNLSRYAEALKLDIGKGKATFMPGSVYMELQEAWKKMPDAEKVKAMYKLDEAITNSNGVVFTGDNKFLELEDFKRIISGEYSTVDKYLDNLSGPVDTFGLGMGTLLKNLYRKGSRLMSRSIDTVQQKIAQRRIVNTTAPSAPMETLKASNPDKAKGALSAIAQSEGDEMAQALTGTTRSDALASEVLPQPAVVDGTIEAKIVNPDEALKGIQPDEKIVKATEDSGGTQWTNSERLRAGENIYKNINNLTGMHAFDNMTSVALTGDKVVIKGLYGTSEGGFKNAEEAFNQAKFAFREYGVRDDAIKLYKKIDGEYVPIDLDEAKLAPGDYTVGVDFDYKFTKKDVGELDNLDVKWNLFDRLPILRSLRSGTVANHLMTNASMLHPTITGSASVAVDKAVKIDKLFLEMHSKFSDGFTKLPAARQAKLYEHIKEANELGLELTDMQLLGRGFVPEEVDLMHQWRKNWDTHFYYENRDVIKTLRNQNYHVFEDTANGTKLYARPIGKNGNLSHVYDPSMNQVRQLSRLEMDQLYDAGGTFAEFRRPVKINGVETEHMMVRNTPNEYLRALHDSDQILNYRKGYFQVGYKAPFFVVERGKSNGKEYWKAVEVAGSTEEAQHIKQRLATSQGRSLDDFDIRNDVKEMRPDTDYYWDLQHASGRIAQRHRGKLLEDATSSVGGFNGKYIMDPVESAIRASRSLSSRVAMRDVIETHKARAMAQYGEFFPEEKGMKQWVENSNSLVDQGKMDSKAIADARTTVEYINFLERGYENRLDDLVKGGFNLMAKFMSFLGTSKGEKFFLWAKEGKPVELAKNGVFQAYIALNVPRQLLVQSHQAIRLVGYNPIYMTKSAGGTLDIAAYIMHKGGNLEVARKLASDIDDKVKFVRESGMLDAVDKHNLTAGSLTDMATSRNFLTKMVGKAFEIPRKAGFDLGEQASLVLHILAVRDKYLRAGKNLADPFVRDEAYSVARALSYDMNRAGDMPYNSNSLGLFLQFLQVPHKAVAAVTTNRRIPGWDRLRMAAVDVALFGVPGGTAIYNMLPDSVLPEDPKKREATLFGLTSIAYNALFSKLAGEDTKVDVSGLSPYGVDGFSRFFEAVLTGGFKELFTNSPSATMYFNDDSRMREAFSRMFKYAGHITEEGHEPEDIVSVLKGIAEVSSGWTNAMKAEMILETGKLKDKKGSTLAENLNWVHAAAQVFGLQPMEVKLNYEALKGQTNEKKDKEERTEKIYKSYIRVLARQGLSNQDPDYLEKVAGLLDRRFQGDLEAQQLVTGWLKRDLPSLRDRITKRAIEQAGLTMDENNASVGNLKVLDDPDYKKMFKLQEDMREQVKHIYGE